MPSGASFPSSAGAQRAPGSSNSSCPVGFDYLRDFPSTLAACDQTNLKTTIELCCSALLNSLGIALSEYLKTTGGFEFRDNATATACLEDFQAGLTANGVKQKFVSSCFPVPLGSTARFIQSPDLCAGIMDVEDWSRVVGGTAMDSSCSGDLSRGADCQGCVDDAEAVVKKLNDVAGHGRPECVYFTVLYAAGRINVYGPGEPSTVECLLGISPPVTKSSSSNVVKIVLGVVIPAAVLFVVATGLIIWRLQLKNMEMHREFQLMELAAYESPGNLTPNRGLILFKARELRAATKNFSDSNFVGEGATGRVYRGSLRGRGEVAIKIMKPSYMQDIFGDGEEKFLQQMKLMNSLRHKTLVQLRGCAIDNTKQGVLLQHKAMVVYDYMPNGNLEQALFNNTGRALSWPQRRKMAVDVATAINYLHNEVQPGVVHRDIKPSNILLDSSLNARLADFGLAKVVAAEQQQQQQQQQEQHDSLAAGTPLFVAPEYALYGHLTQRSDVYGFGMVLLLLLSGKRPLFHSPESGSQVHVAEYAWKLFTTGRGLEVVEESVRGSGPASVMERFLRVGLLCAHPLLGMRPGIRQALAMLQGDLEVPDALPDRPLFSHQSL